MDSFIGWVGGKKKFRDQIVSKFPKHNCYVEVFGGGGWILFHKKPSNVEVYNDLNGDLVNLFKVIRDQNEEFKNYIKWILASRDTFNEYSKMEKDDINKLGTIERAARFFFLIKTGFSSNPNSGTFSRSTETSSRWNPNINLEKHRRRLSNVYIENLSFEKLIPLYDSPNTLFYMDPPYIVADKGGYYEYHFNEELHVQLSEVCKTIKGKFLISYDIHPKIDELYKDFNIIKTDPVTYCMEVSQGEQRSKKEEYLVSNYSFPNIQDNILDLILGVDSIGR